MLAGIFLLFHSSGLPISASSLSTDTCLHTMQAADAVISSGLEIGI